MSELYTEIKKNGNEDIDSKIADFMADIDEIVLGKKSNDNAEQSEWKQCFDDTTQAIYYWNTKTNDCSWDPPPITSENHVLEKSTNSTNVDGINKNKRPLTTSSDKSSKKMKKPSLIAEYTSSESESSEEEEENVDDIDELLNEVLDQDKKVPPVDVYPLFEADCRAAIARLTDLGDKTIESLTLRIQLETRLEDCLAGHLSKSYAISKLEEALIQIDEFEKLHLISTSLAMVPEPPKPSLTSSEMVLLLSLPPPPPSPSPPPPPSSSNEDDKTLQLFYAQLNCDQPDLMSAVFDMEKTSMATKSEQQHPHHHHKDKKSKPAKTLPTGLIQKWAHARQELHGGIDDIDDT